MIRPRPQAIFVILLGLWAAWLPGPGNAGQIKISPIRVDLSAASPVGVLTIGNPSSESILLHLRLKAWSHAGGSDTFEDTRDLLLNPMIFELGPGEEQVVRVGLTHPLREERESSFRLFIQEVHDEASKKAQAIATQLRISLPLFVAPSDPLPAELAWSLVQRPGGEMALKVINSGNLHAELFAMGLYRQNGDAVSAVEQRVYILAGGAREWVFPAGSVTKKELLTLVTDTKEGPLETPLRLERDSPIEEALR